MIHNTVYFATQLWFNITRNLLMSAAALSTSTIALLTLGIFLIVAKNIDYMTTEKLPSMVEIRAFLKKDAKDADVKSLIAAVEKLPHVKRVEYVSPAAALATLEKNFEKKGLKKDLGLTPDENPLPPALKIHVDDPRQIEAVAKRVKADSKVDELLYGETVLQKILALSITVKFVGFFVTLLMGVGTLLTLINTIRLTVLARRAEIRTMQLVGATGWFIRWPFLLEGVFIGLAGALLAALLVSLGYMFFETRIKDVLGFIADMLVDFGPMTRALFPLLCLCGVFMGLAGSYISVTRFLKEEV